MNKMFDLLRTTTVRLTALFIVIFVAASIVLLAFIAYQSSIVIQQRQTADIAREVNQLRRVERQRGMLAVAQAVQRMAARPGQGIYYLGDDAGRSLAGNVSNFPDYVLTGDGFYSFDYEKGGPALTADDPRYDTRGFALVDSTLLDSGLRLIVGRDIVERRDFSAIIFQSFVIGVAGIVLFSILAGWLTAKRVLRRIDSISETSTKIVSGNLSERVPVTKRNDEFDQLAISLNAMLDRIEQLMVGLKEVTDNVAHDLKTPLTRLRNKAEAALRDEKDPEVLKQALETTIVESDQLIRTFNALLMIARVEAGAPSGALTDIDLSAVVNDVAEMYGPVAEDAGMKLEADVAEGVRLTANRELIGQALVNLVENALKYATIKANDGVVSLSVRRVGNRVQIEVADNGPGIAEEDRDHVVKRFVRLEKSRTEVGSGLGLSLVNAVARLHKGSLKLEDNKPGLRAIIDMPA